MAIKKTVKEKVEPSQEEAMAYAAATYVDDKKAEDVVIMDVRGISPVTDYYVICTATSMPHLKAVSNEVRERFWQEHRRHPIASDEKMESLWLIQHYGDVMVHIFHKDKRDFYALEELWGDAPRLAWTPAAPPEMLSLEKKAPAKKDAKKTAAKKVAAKAAKKAPAKKAAKKS